MRRWEWPPAFHGRCRALSWVFKSTVSAGNRYFRASRGQRGSSGLLITKGARGANQPENREKPRLRGLFAGFVDLVEGRSRALQRIGIGRQRVALRGAADFHGGTRPKRLHHLALLGRLFEPGPVAVLAAFLHAGEHLELVLADRRIGAARILEGIADAHADFILGAPCRPV